MPQSTIMAAATALVVMRIILGLTSIFLLSHFYPFLEFGMEHKKIHCLQIVACNKRTTLTRKTKI